MNKKLLFIILCLILSLSLAARTAIESDKVKTEDGKTIDVGNLRMPITNYGQFGQNIETGRAGTDWPNGSGEYYIYGGGIWVGMQDADGNFTVAVGYDPNNGNTEFVPGTMGTASDYDDPVNVVYTNTSADWPPETPDSRFTAPGSEPVSIQDTWCMYTDKDPLTHDANEPLGLIVDQVSYAWNYDDNEDFIFITYDFYNYREDGADLNDIYVGMAMDPDVGDSEDDMVGFNEDYDLAYTYDFDADEPGWDRVPGYVGFSLLETPQGDDGEQVGMSAFQIITIDQDPKSESAKFSRMTGFDDPDTDIDESATWERYQTDGAPADKRSLQVCGPLDLAYGEKKRIVIAVIAAANEETLFQKAQAARVIYDLGYLLPKPPPAPELTLTHLDGRIVVSWDDAAEAYRDPYFWFASSPVLLTEFKDELTITGTPQDAVNGTATITATEPDNITDYLNADGESVVIVDVDGVTPVVNSLQNTDYVMQDFEGYRLYKSETGLPGSWNEIYDVDLASFAEIEQTVSIEEVHNYSGIEVTLDMPNMEGYFWAYGGLELLYGHDFQMGFKMVDDTLRFDIYDITDNTYLEPSGSADHWYNHGDDPRAYEVFGPDLWSVYDLNLAEDIPFDSCWVYFGGVALQIFGQPQLGDMWYIHTTPYISTAQGGNTGLSHLYVDENLTNGLEYYYAITSYDFNVSPIELESSLNLTIQMGRPTNMANGFPDAEDQVLIDATGNELLDTAVEFNLINPLAVTGDDYQITIGNSNWDVFEDFGYTLENLTNGTVLIDNAATDGSMSAMVEGMTFGVTAPSGDLATEDIVGTSDIDFAQAYMGGRNAQYYGHVNPFELRFTGDNTGPIIPNNQTDIFMGAPFEVWDLGDDLDDPADDRQMLCGMYDFNGDQVFQFDDYLIIYCDKYEGNYYDATDLQSFANVALHQEAGYWGYDPADPISRRDWSFRFNFNSAFWNVGDVLRCNPTELIAPGSTIDISTVGAGVVADNIDMDNIKVVPNPYIVTDGYDKKPRTGDAMIDRIPVHYIDFINLPPQCDIYIFTIAGDLVKTINYDGIENVVEEGVVGVSYDEDGGIWEFGKEQIVDEDGNPIEITDSGNEFAGRVRWNMLSDSGRRLASGVYFYCVKGYDSNHNSVGEFTGKFGVVH